MIRFSVVRLLCLQERPAGEFGENLAVGLSDM